MPYPFVSMPSPAEFIETAMKNGFQVQLLQLHLEETVWYFERIVPTRPPLLTCALPPKLVEDQGPMGVELVRACSDALEIPRAIFGLTLE